MVKVSDQSLLFTDATFTKEKLDAWVTQVAAGRTVDELLQLKTAAEFAIKAHAGQERESGEPYVGHVFAVAEILGALNLDTETLCAALLHDVVEDTDVSLDQVKQSFGPVVTKLVDGVTKMKLTHDFPAGQKAHAKDQKHQAENLRKLLLAMVEDVRVVLIKLADRLHNMRTLNTVSVDKQQRIADETLNIYAPLANRLGIWQIKWELEDLSLRYINPEEYKQIAHLLDERRVDREKYITRVIDTLNVELNKAGVNSKVQGRPKHIYSIWKKMQRKQIGFDQIFDVRAVRILVASVADCYAVLGIVHTLWQHIPREFDDYIATPKENDYQSLHTAVIGPESKTLEVQIRTQDMHEHSELGIASHWRYKEGSKFDARYEAKIAWLRQILEWKDSTGTGDFLDQFKAEVFQDRVYVLTPKGNVLDLPNGATPLDFAYAIHTDLGHGCRGAKVNGHIVPLTYVLKNGEQVEVMTARQGGPSRDWLNPQLGYLKSARALSKVRAWFNFQDQDKNIADGRVIVDRELARVAVGKVSYQALASVFQVSHLSDFFSMVGRGELTPSQIVTAASLVLNLENAPAQVLVTARAQHKPEKSGNVRIEGVDNLLTHFARCCKPVPHDPIVGFITRGRGVTIHRKDCVNIVRMRADEQERKIDVSWNSAPGAMYSVDVVIEAQDRRGLLKDVSATLANEEVNVLAVNTLSDPRTNIAVMNLTLEISDITQLSKILLKINQLTGIQEVRRKF